MEGPSTPPADRPHTRASTGGSEHRYRQLFDLAPDACVVTDANGVIVEANRRAAALFGRAVPDLYGEPLIAFVAPPDRRRFHSLAVRLLRGEHVEGWEATVASPEAPAAVPVEVSVHPVRTADGALDELRWLLRDASERKRLEREAIEVADRQRLLIGQELHDDVSQRLTGALFLLHSLNEDLRKRRSAFTDRVERVVHHLAGAMKALRVMSHRLAIAVVPPEALVDALAELAETTHAVTGVRCELEADAAPVLLDPDAATHLLRIAQEAVANAARHASPRTIRLQLHVADEGGLLRIADDGPGFDPVTAEEQGGLGLRSMRLRASYIGGTLEVARRPGGGAVVECRFPIAPGVGEDDEDVDDDGAPGAG